MLYRFLKCDYIIVNRPSTSCINICIENWVICIYSVIFCKIRYTYICGCITGLLQEYKLVSNCHTMSLVMVLWISLAS